MATSAPKPKAASAMRMSSVATITRSSRVALHAFSHTCWMSGLPATGCNDLPGNRVEPQRAGMMPTILPMLCRFSL